MIDHATNRLSPEFVLLGFLYQKPNHGYDLHKQIEAEFENVWHTSQSQVYNILSRLQSQGYIRSTQVEQKNLPPRQLLYITEIGKERFQGWLDTPTKPSVHAIRVEFISRLYFMNLYCPKKVPDMIRKQVEVVSGGLALQENNLRDLPDNETINRLALELRIKLLRSVISWLKVCDTAIEPGPSSGTDHA